MGKTFYGAWEVALMVWMQGPIGEFGTALFSAISALGEELVLIGVVGFLYWCVDKKTARFVAVNLISVSVWGPMLKNAVMRRRPYMDHAQIRCLKPLEAGADLSDTAAQGFSFPSIHSAISSNTYGSIALRLRRRWVWILACIIPFLIGISRIVLGVHYPTDVLAGWALGIGSAFLLTYLQRWIRDERILFGILLLIGFPGFFFCSGNDFFTAYGTMVGLFAGFLFEDRFVRFSLTRNPIRAILRVAGGIGLFLGLNILLKLPFSPEFLNSATMGAFMVRTARYALGCFLIIGIYPLLFRFTAKIGSKKQDSADSKAETPSK